MGWDSVKIRTCANGYIVIKDYRSPDPLSVGTFSGEKPFVFPTLDELFQWLRANLETPTP